MTPPLNEHQAAEFLGIIGRDGIIPSPATLRYWRRHGEGPAYLKMGRLIRYEVEELQRFKEACKVPAKGA